MSGTAWCSRHQAFEPVEGFNKSARAKNGLQPSCRVAQKVYYEANREAERAQKKAHYEANKEAVLARAKANKEAHAARAKAYYEANKEAVLAQQKAWYEANPEKVKAHTQRRRALKLNATGSFSADEWVELCEAYDYRCLCCGQREGDISDKTSKPIKITADHVIPLSRGGSNGIENIQPLCFSCNSSKGNHHSTDYRKG